MIVQASARDMKIKMELKRGSLLAFQNNCYRSLLQKDMNSPIVILINFQEEWEPKPTKRSPGTAN